MKKIIVCFLILIFALTNTTFSFARYDTSIDNTEFSFNIQQFRSDVPAPGCLKNGELDLISNYISPKTSLQHDRVSVEYSNDIVSLIQLVNEELYLEFLKEIVAFGPRVTTSEECQEAGYYIYNEFLDMGVDTRIQEWDNGNLF